MSDKVRIALDAMGGDHGPAVVVAGADLALTRHPGTEFLFFGNTALVAPLVDARPSLKAASKLVHTDIAVRMEDKPSQALRYGRWKSSMWLAIDAVKKGDADVAVSGGNTGALMAMSKFNLKTLPGIERPAIAALWPTLRGESVVLDRRRLDRRRCRPPRRPCRDGRRHGAHPVRPRSPDCRAAQYRRRRSQRPRTGARSRPPFCASRNCPASIITASSKATISARAPSTSSSPKALPATLRSRPPKAPRGRSANI